MSAPKTRQSELDEIPDTTPQTIPNIGLGHPDFNYILATLEIQKTLTEVNCSLKMLEKSQEGIKTKVDDLVKWKHMILGGAVVIGVVCSLIVWVATKVSDYVSFNSPDKASITQVAPPSVTTQPK